MQGRKEDNFLRIIYRYLIKKNFYNITLLTIFIIFIFYFYLFLFLFILFFIITQFYTRREFFLRVYPENMIILGQHCILENFM